jgi:cytoskeletal protein RodZ
MAETVGEILRGAREECGLVVADLAQVTRIPTGSIVALEEDNFDALPAPVFVRGFIRNLCREVGIDASEVLGVYDAYLADTAIDQDADDMTGIAPLLFMSDAHLRQPSHNRGLQISHILLLALAFVTFIIAYMTAGQSAPMTNTAQQETTPATETRTAQQARPEKPGRTPFRLPR